MKKIQLVFLATFLLSMFSYGQITEVSINVSSTGITEEAAKSSALRLAIEQAFGTFVSSRSEILNDSLVEDQIVSISNGNIKKFEVLSSLYLADQKVYLITVNATVSLDKLASFVQSKGYNDVSFDGGGFAMNLKIQRFNETSEKTAISNLLEQGLLISENIFDRELKIGSPILESEVNSTIPKYKIKLSVSTKLNQNWNEYYEYFKKTLLKISMSNEEQVTYTELNKKIYRYVFLDKYSEIIKEIDRFNGNNIVRERVSYDNDNIDTAAFRTPDALFYLTSFYTILSAKYLELVSISHDLDTVNLDIRLDAKYRIRSPKVHHGSGFWDVGRMPFDNWVGVHTGKNQEDFKQQMARKGLQQESLEVQRKNYQLILLNTIYGPPNFPNEQLQVSLFQLYRFISVNGWTMPYSGSDVEGDNYSKIINVVNSKDYKTAISTLHNQIKKNYKYMNTYFDRINDALAPVCFDIHDKTVMSYEIDIKLSFTEEELYKIKSFKLIKI
jgi:hypothetical protein